MCFSHRCVYKREYWVRTGKKYLYLPKEADSLAHPIQRSQVTRAACKYAAGSAITGSKISAAAVATRSRATPSL